MSLFGMDWTDVLKHHGTRISVGGKGQWMDNVFIERLLRSMKYEVASRGVVYECIYLNAVRNFRNSEDHLRNWMGYYNARRPHSALGDLTQTEVYNGIESVPSAAS